MCLLVIYISSLKKYLFGYSAYYVIGLFVCVCVDIELYELFVRVG